MAPRKGQAAPGSPLVRRSSIVVIAAVLAAMTLLIILVLLLLPRGSAACGTDTACYVRHAQRCEEATVLVSVADTIIEFNDKDCFTSRHPVLFSPNETDGVVLLLDGTSMGCAHDEGEFPEAWFTSLTEGLERCHGSMRDALAALQEAALQSQGPSAR